METALDLAGSLPADGVCVIDCLTLWASNLLFAERDIPAETERLLAAARGCAGTLIFVTNEVGCGIVPENALARRFRDEAGRLKTLSGQRLFDFDRLDEPAAAEPSIRLPEPEEPTTPASCFAEACRLVDVGDVTAATALYRRVLRERPVDILVVGSHGHGWVRDLLYGETVDRVRHGLDVPMLIARHDPQAPGDGGISGETDGIIGLDPPIRPIP